jgi:hypothetical protein
MADPGSTAVVITGMHRSGTSFVASALEAAGLPVGERLLDDFPGNPRGHFEDLDFVDVHEAALASLPEGSFVTSEAPLAFDAGQRARVAELIAARSTLPAWGFKDPRTTLFLDEWRRLLPRARWVLLYRHPLEVLTSILRRAVNRDVLAVPELGLRVWRAYNERLLAFHAAHRPECLLASIDAVGADVAGFVERVAAPLGVRLDGARAAARFHSDELRAIAVGTRAEAVLRRLFPDVASTLARLDAAADLARPARSAPDAEGIGLVEALVSVPGAPALACLLALVAPDTWSRVPAKLLASIRAVESEQRKLGAEWQEHARYIHAQAAYIGNLEAERARLVAEAERLAAEVERLAAERRTLADASLLDQILRRLRSR